MPVNAAETLWKSSTRYIQYEKTILTVRKRFLNSLIYPAFLVVLSIVMVGVILTFVIPQFAELYAGLNTPLPVSTRVLIAISDDDSRQSDSDCSRC